MSAAQPIDEARNQSRVQHYDNPLPSLGSTPHLWTHMNKWTLPRPPLFRNRLMGNARDISLFGRNKPSKLTLTFIIVFITASLT